MGWTSFWSRFGAANVLFGFKKHTSKERRNKKRQKAKRQNGSRREGVHSREAVAKSINMFFDM